MICCNIDFLLGYSIENGYVEDKATACTVLKEIAEITW
jgi:hypothetical protein